MTLLYKPVKSTMPTKDGEYLWYPRIVKIGRMITTQDLAVAISKASSLSEGDVHNVIRNLMSVMRFHLQNSHSVQLDGLGSFTIKAQTTGNGAETAEKVHFKQINYLKIQFTPSYRRIGSGIGKVCPMLEGAEFEKF
jgi:predicted histone-like DNA-binding protein